MEDTPNLSDKPRTPFGYSIRGPHYTYKLFVAEDGNNIPIYVGRGRGRRILKYFGLPLIRRSKKPFPLAKYYNPKTHNSELDAEITRVRALGRDIVPISNDHGNDPEAAKAHEKELIKKYGRRDLGTGILLNRNAGG